MTDKLDDVWASRDFPVLVAAARILDAGDGPAEANDICRATGLSSKDVFAAFDALV